LLIAPIFFTIPLRFLDSQLQRRDYRKHTMVGQKYFRGGKRAFRRGAKYTKYNKINNNSENFKGQDCLLPREASPPGSYSVRAWPVEE